MAAGAAQAGDGPGMICSTSATPDLLSGHQGAASGLASAGPFALSLPTHATPTSSRLICIALAWLQAMYWRIPATVGLT